MVQYQTHPKIVDKCTVDADTLVAHLTASVHIRRILFDAYTPGWVLVDVFLAGVEPPVLPRA